MGLQGGAMAVSLMRTLKKNQQDYESIQAAKHKQAQEDQRFELEMKAAKADLELKKDKGVMSSLELKNFQQMLKDKEKLRKAQAQAAAGEIEQAEHENKQTARQVNQVARVYTQKFTTNSKGQMSETYGYTEKDVRPTTDVARKMDLDARKTLGMIDTGKWKNEDGAEEEIKTRGRAEELLSSNLGYGWQDEYPQAMEVLNKKFPENPDSAPMKAFKEGSAEIKKSIGEVKALFNKNGITKTSEAIPFLMENFGVTKEQAIKYLSQK